MLRLASTPPSAPHFRATIRRSGPVAAFHKAQTFLLSASLGRQKALPLRILLHSLHVDKLKHICMPRQHLLVKKLYHEPLPIPLWIVTPWIYVLLWNRQLRHSSNRFAKPILQGLELPTASNIKATDSIAMFWKIWTYFPLPPPALPPLKTHTIRLRRQDFFFLPEYKIQLSWNRIFCNEVPEMHLYTKRFKQ